MKNNDNQKNMKNLIKKLMRKRRCHLIRKAYKKLFKKMHQINKTYDIRRPFPSKMEAAWLNRYRKLDEKTSIDNLRFYGQYVKNYMNIIPYETYAIYIAPLLNPPRFNPFFDDKNNLDTILPEKYIAQTVLHRINGIYKNKNYAVIPSNLTTILSYLKGYKTLIIKPAYKSLGGKGVSKLILQDGSWYLHDHKVTMDDFNLFNENFIIQDCISQSAFFSQFNSSSVNTMRMCVYRSVVTDEISIIVNLLRIGKSGNTADNILMGGRCIKINDDGSLVNELFDNWGNLSTSFNGIDFANNKFVIPNYEKVKELGLMIPKYFPHHHLLALDIAMNENNEPKLVEVNADGFSLEMPYFAHIDMFGDKTDEILHFAMKYKNEIHYTM